jgi:hypothetical protein
MGDSPVSILHNTSGTEIATVANPVRVDPTGTTTQPVSATALPLPTGAATAAKQPALGTAGTPSADVLSVQGVSGGTPQPVSDGGGSITVDGTVTANAGTGPFPVSDNGGSLTVDGAVTANIGTSGSLALDATLTGGTQKAIVRGGAKGTTVAADVTSTAEGADHQALDVQIMHGGAAKDPTQIRALTASDVVTANAGTGPFPVSDNGGSLTVDGAVTANIGTSGSLALDATLTGGTQKAIVRGGAKGATAAADVTSTAEGADHQALDVQIMHGGAAKDPTQVRALTSADVVTAAQGTAAAAAGGWPAKVTDGTNVAAVKAASTAAVAADPALVVAVSPNNTPVLPSGAATSALQGTGNTSLSNIDGKLATLGQKAMAGSVPVTLASDQSAVPVADGGGSLTIDATALPLPTGASTETTLSAVSTKLPATLGQKAMAASLAVTLASDQSVIAMRDAPATAATVASVAAAVADTTLLAANASRMGASVANASTAILYLKLGTGASAASYTVRMTPNAYYEVPFGYSGQINGYWAAANGAALVTQVTQ